MAVVTAGASAWATLRGRHPGERFYSFGLYTTDLAEYLSVTASTEEGLSEVTQRYVTQTGRDPGAQRLSLRWSPCDSPFRFRGSSDGALAATSQVHGRGRRSKCSRCPSPSRGR